MTRDVMKLSGKTPFMLCIMATMTSLGAFGADVIVSTSWLNARLQRTTSNGRPEVHVIEASWTVNERQLGVEHIPGASLLDLRHCSTPTSTRPHNNPDTSCLERYIRCLGVDDDLTPVVFYDRIDGMYESARAWWIVGQLYGRGAVTVLDGGLGEWKRQGLDTVIDSWRRHADCRSPTGNWTAKLDARRLREFPQMVIDVASGDRQIVDTRMTSNFRGDVVEPSIATVLALNSSSLLLWQRMRRGHMSSARNIPFTSFIDPSNPGRLLKLTELCRLFQTVDIDVHRPLTMTCYIGSSACLGALAATVCGAEDVAVYSGSWTEWSQQAFSLSSLFERGDGQLDMSCHLTTQSENPFHDIDEPWFRVCESD